MIHSVGNSYQRPPLCAPRPRTRVFAIWLAYLHIFSAHFELLHLLPQSTSHPLSSPLANENTVPTRHSPAKTVKAIWMLLKSISIFSGAICTWPMMIENMSSYGPVQRPSAPPIKR